MSRSHKKKSTGDILYILALIQNDEKRKSKERQPQETKFIT